jgi:hypothetical protein
VKNGRRDKRTRMNRFLYIVGKHTTQNNAKTVTDVTFFPLQNKKDSKNAKNGKKKIKKFKEDKKKPISR